MYQKVEIIGNLGTDPDLRYTPQGEAVCSFSVATNRKWTGQDGQKQEQVTWFRISAWEKTGEACNQYLSKGRQVFIEGQLQPDKATGGPRVWTDNDGNARASFEIRAFTVKFLGGSQDQGNDQSGDSQSGQGDPIAPDEIPF